MEHTKNFANLDETLSAKFPDLDKSYLYIHILGYVSGFDKPLFFDCHSGIAPIVSHFTFDKNILIKIEESFPANQLSEREKKDLCKYFLEVCLQFERRIEVAPKSPATFFNDLLLTDPQAVSNNNGNYLVSSSELSAQSYKQFIDWDIERYFYYKTPRVPKQINEKIVALAEPKNRQTIYDPNCGDGSLFVEFYNKFPDAEFTFNGVVGNQFERLFCLVNFYVNGILDDKRIEFEIEVSSPLADAVEYHNSKSDDDYFPRETANVAISFVPVKRQLTDGERDSRFLGFSYSLEQPEYAYIELMLNAVRDTGKAIAIVPDSVLYSSEGRFFREAYLSRDWIESVISLPENSFNQDDFSEASIIVFNKNKTEKGIVVFDGERSEFERTEIKNGAILSENDVDLRAARYALKQIKSIRNTIERHQERNFENPAVPSTENVALHQYFDDLAETFSEKFPTVKNTVYLYLLIVVMMILDRGNQWLLSQESFLINSKIYKEIELFIYKDYYKKIIDIVLANFIDKDLSWIVKPEDLIIGEYGIETESPFKNALRELCKYLITRCLQIEDKVEPRDIEDLWKEIARKEPQAIQLEQRKILDFEHLLEELKSGQFSSVQVGSYRSSVDFSEFSDGAYQELSEAFIAQSFYYEKNYLQLFDRLDEVLAKIANPKPGQKIFDPNCGIGSGFVELQKQFPNHELRFTGRVDDSFFHILCEANLLAHNVKAFINREEILDSDIEATFWGDAPDISIGISPIKIELLGKRDAKFFKLSHKRKNVEYSFIELMINCLGENGKAVVVVPEEFLYRWNAKGFKESYLKNDWIESVISLSEDTFEDYGSVKAAIVVFNKNKAEKGFVTFKSQNGQFEETQVRLEEILSLDRLDLRANRYALKEAKELKNILANTPYPVIKIRDIIQSSVAGVNYSLKSRIDENSVDDLPYVRVSNLAKNETQFDLDISKVERKISRKKANKKTVIDYSAVLVSKIAPKLKSTYFNFTNQPIVIGSDIIALKMKEDIVNVEYFITQLHSRLVQIQVEMFSSGTTINRITKEDFLNIQILLPSLEEQKHRAEEFRDSVFKVAKEVIEAESERDEAEYQTIANINHSLKNKLGAIVGGYDTLVRFLKRKERENAPVRFDEPVFPLREGENIQDVDTIATITERLKKHLLDASNVFNSFEKIEQKRHLQKEPVELVGYFQNELKSLYSGKNYTIEVLAKPKLKLNVLIDKEAFKDIIENLIDNARKHGFISEDRKYKVVFELSKQEDVYDEASESYTNYARILYKNDGKPFPKGFSFDEYIEYSNKAGKTQGTGIGGSIVFRQIKQHGGKLNCISIDENDSPFPIQFEILLPLDD